MEDDTVDRAAMRRVMLQQTVRADIPYLNKQIIKDGILTRKCTAMNKRAS